MALFITISGPQSSGKSTIFKHLKEKYKKRGIKFVNEINPYEYKKSDHPSYLSTYSIQETLTKMTLRLLKKVNKKANYVMETGPMQIVYIEKYNGLNKASLYFKKYLEILKPLNPVIIFIDTKPDISFKRRKKTYLERIKRHKLENKQKEIMDLYRKKIFDLYPLWHKWLGKFPFEKRIIKNSYKSEKQFIKEVENIVNNLMLSETMKRRSPVRRRIS